MVPLRLAVKVTGVLCARKGEVMYIESLVLQNFRCFGNQRTVIPLGPGLTPFIGSNGAGKTAACQALQRLFGITNDQRTVRVDDFHAPAGETSPGGETKAQQPRTLTIEAVLAFPELDDDDDQGKDAVPEFFHRMAADDQGTLKCRIVLEARWEADGTLDGGLSENRWVVEVLEGAPDFAEPGAGLALWPNALRA